MGTTPTLILSTLDDMKALLGALESLVVANVHYLERHPEVSHPYRSGLYYDNEPIGREEWLGVEALLRAGWGDCEDLAAYLAAWYRARKGIFAKVILKRFSKKGRVWYHAVVQLPDGSIEDPSKKLGM